MHKVNSNDFSYATKYNACIIRLLCTTGMMNGCSQGLSRARAISWQQSLRRFDK